MTYFIYESVVKTQTFFFVSFFSYLYVEYCLKKEVIKYPYHKEMAKSNAELVVQGYDIH